MSRCFRRALLSALPLHIGQKNQTDPRARFATGEANLWSMSEMGQQRPLGEVCAMSAIAPGAAQKQTFRFFGLVLVTDVISSERSVQ